ncbi:hypothetical protein CPB84DRAFT_262421 [Gymnopilus junonius]|uniref:Uncharacterized protein n=1 Tax=Gymnopilus junonius TaxID=109634 RepID=A0A9P5TI71_GYMJU|nr:hypothetical protein CPB84DRAFT_262421 [Gymnopilus junonius]
MLFNLKLEYICACKQRYRLNVSSLHIPCNSLGLITPIPHVQAKTPYGVSNLSTSAHFHGLSSSLPGGHAAFFESLHDQQHGDTFTIATGDPFMFPSYSSGFSNSEPTETFEGMSYPEETNIGPPPHPFLLPSLGPWERRNYAITDFSLISNGGEEQPQNSYPTKERTVTAPWEFPSSLMRPLEAKVGGT